MLGLRVSEWFYVCDVILLRSKAATALARFSHRNSVRLSVRHTGGLVKNGAS